MNVNILTEPQMIFRPPCHAEIRPSLCAIVSNYPDTQSHSVDWSSYPSDSSPLTEAETCQATGSPSLARPSSRPCYPRGRRPTRVLFKAAASANRCQCTTACRVRTGNWPCMLFLVALLTRSNIAGNPLVYLSKTAFSVLSSNVYVYAYQEISSTLYECILFKLSLVFSPFFSIIVCLS